MSHVAVQQSTPFCAVHNGVISTLGATFEALPQRTATKEPVQLLFTLISGSGCHGTEIQGRSSDRSQTFDSTDEA
jgi:hypothetical protein